MFQQSCTPTPVKKQPTPPEPCKKMPPQEVKYPEPVITKTKTPVTKAPEPYHPTTKTIDPFRKECTLPDPQTTKFTEPKAPVTKHVPNPYSQTTVPVKKSIDCQQTTTKFNQKVDFQQTSTPWRSTAFDYDEFLEVKFKTCDVSKAGTDGIFSFYLAETDKYGRVTGEPFGPHIIKSEGDFLERGTIHSQNYKTGKHQKRSLLDNLGDALIIHKQRTVWYDSISDAWKPEYITVHYKKTGASKTFHFPKCEESGWLDKNGFYIIKYTGEFSFVTGSDKKNIYDIIEA